MTDSNVLNLQYKDELQEDCQPLLNAYSDLEQISKKEQEAGYVKVTFISKGDDGDKYNENTICALGEEVKRLQQNGIPLNQIVILLRSKRQLGNIATWFDRELHIPVVSNEAFRLDTSVSIHIIINALRYLSNKEDHIAEAALRTDY